MTCGISASSPSRASPPSRRSTSAASNSLAYRSLSASSSNIGPPCATSPSLRLTSLSNSTSSATSSRRLACATARGWSRLTRQSIGDGRNRLIADHGRHWPLQPARQSRHQERQSPHPQHGLVQGAGQPGCHCSQPRVHQCALHEGDRSVRRADLQGVPSVEGVLGILLHDSKVARHCPSAREHVAEHGLHVQLQERCQLCMWSNPIPSRYSSSQTAPRLSQRLNAPRSRGSTWRAAA